MVLLWHLVPRTTQAKNHTSQSQTYPPDLGTEYATFMHCPRTAQHSASTTHPPRPARKTSQNLQSATCIPPTSTSHSANHRRHTASSVSSMKQYPSNKHVFETLLRFTSPPPVLVEKSCPDFAPHPDPPSPLRLPDPRNCYGFAILPLLHNTKTSSTVLPVHTDTSVPRVQMRAFTRLAKW